MTSFPSDFKWGCATSAYQIEGALDEDGRGLSNWEVFGRGPGRIAQDAVASPACDHYHRFQDDVRLMADLGFNAYRFSVAWPRVLPQGTGKGNPRGWAFYDRLVDALLSRGIEPFLTLYHWDHPSILDDRGGWLNRDFAFWMADYAALAARRLSDRVSHWVTINEPPCVVHLGHQTGEHAPGLRLPPSDVGQVAHHVLLAHGLSVQALRAEAKKNLHIGLAHNPENKVPESPHDTGAARLLWRKANANWFEPLLKGRYPEDGPLPPDLRAGDMANIHQPLDFMGLNVYHGVRVRDTPEGPRELPFTEGLPTTAMGWPVLPEALRWGLRFFHEDFPALPIHILENGAAYDDRPGGGDAERISFIENHLEQLRLSLSDGVPVKGYFHWTLMDNFEWSHGYTKRFGLCRLDPDLARVPRAGALWFKKRLGRGGL